MNSVPANTPNDPQSGVPSMTGSGSERPISCLSCRHRKLRCDRVKPKCGTCSRLQHKCEFPERKKYVGARRRYMEDMNIRLAQVETQVTSKSDPPTPEASAVAADWSLLGMGTQLDSDNSTPFDSTFQFPLLATGMYQDTPLRATDNFTGQELAEQGLSEALPAPALIDELHQIFFEKFYPTLPLIHKYRYYVSLNRAPLARPPVCLRYIIWAIAASLSERHKTLEDPFYERSRRYIEESEMKGDGFVTMYHAQTWCLIAMLEAKKARFSRSWMSVGRAVRLVQMLGLYSLDAEGGEAKKIISRAQDWIEHEERRRTFWTAFYGDRWASVLTGWPMSINEREILTNLPASEHSFQQGVMEETISLPEALTPEGVQKISPFGGVILAATLYGHNHQHLHSTGSDENPEDSLNGEFWKRYRALDNILVNTFMFLPDQLRLPLGLRDMNVAFTHMSIHASSISLHQGAIAAATKHNIDLEIVRHSQARSLTAAYEIANIMRHISHVDPSDLNSWLGFCLYIAAGVLVRDQKSDQPHRQGLTDLDFLLFAMRALGLRHPITKHFSGLLERDVSAAGIIIGSMNNNRTQRAIPNIPSQTTSDPSLASATASYNSASDFGSMLQRKGIPSPAQNTVLSSSRPPSWDSTLYPVSTTNHFAKRRAEVNRASPSIADLVDYSSRGSRPGEMVSPNNLSVSNTIEVPYRTTSSDQSNRVVDPSIAVASEPNRNSLRNEWSPPEDLSNLDKNLYSFSNLETSWFLD